MLAKAPELQKMSERARWGYSDRETDELHHKMVQVQQAALESMGIKYDHSMLIEHEQPVVQKVLQIPVIREDIAA